MRSSDIVQIFRSICPVVHSASCNIYHTTNSCDVYYRSTYVRVDHQAVLINPFLPIPTHSYLYSRLPRLSPRHTAMEHQFSTAQPHPGWLVYQQPTGEPFYGQDAQMLSGSCQQPMYQPMQYSNNLPGQQQYAHQVAPSQQGGLPSKQAFYGNMALTPVASPQPHNPTPAVTIKSDVPSSLRPIDTTCYDMAANYAPSTPPLSTSGSTVSSPPISSMLLPTPQCGSNFAFPAFDATKGAAETENVMNMNWNQFISPPVTPGKLKFFAPSIYIRL